MKLLREAKRYLSSKTSKVLLSNILNIIFENTKTNTTNTPYTKKTGVSQRTGSVRRLEGGSRKDSRSRSRTGAASQNQRYSQLNRSYYTTTQQTNQSTYQQNNQSTKYESSANGHRSLSRKNANTRQQAGGQGVGFDRRSGSSTQQAHQQNNLSKNYKSVVRRITTNKIVNDKEFFRAGNMPENEISAISMHRTEDFDAPYSPGPGYQLTPASTRGASQVVMNDHSRILRDSLTTKSYRKSIDTKTSRQAAAHKYSMDTTGHDFSFPNASPGYPIEGRVFNKRNITNQIIYETDGFRQNSSSSSEEADEKNQNSDNGTDFEVEEDFGRGVALNRGEFRSGGDYLRGRSAEESGLVRQQLTATKVTNAVTKKKEIEKTSVRRVSRIITMKTVKNAGRDLAYDPKRFQSEKKKSQVLLSVVGFIFKKRLQSYFNMIIKVTARKIILEPLFLIFLLFFQNFYSQFSIFRLF